MRHAFLITLLLTGQFISCNAAPLFLCMDGDGSLCIDLGPGSCACCQHGHDWAEDLSQNPSANGNRHSHQSCDRHQAPATIEATPCDCTHLQITVAWTAVTVSPEANRLIILPSLTALVGNRDGGSALSPPRAGASLNQLSNDLSAATTLRSALLRR